MKQPTRALALVVLLAAGIHFPARAQQAAADTRSLSEIASALTRIATVLEKQLEGGRLDLLMKRVESGQRRLDQVERQLRSAQNDYEGQLQNLKRLDRELRQLAEADLEALGYDQASMQMQMNHLEFESELTHSRIADLERKIAAYQNEEARRRREVEDWQSFIDRELSGLQ